MVNVTVINPFTGRIQGPRGREVRFRPTKRRVRRGGVSVVEDIPESERVAPKGVREGDIVIEGTPAELQRTETKPKVQPKGAEKPPSSISARQNLVIIDSSRTTGDTRSLTLLTQQPKRGLLGRADLFLRGKSQQSEVLAPKPKQLATGLGAGFGSAFVSFGQTLKVAPVLFRPKKIPIPRTKEGRPTIIDRQAERIPSPIKTIKADVITASKLPRKAVVFAGKTFKERPIFTTGRVAGEVALLGGLSFAIRTGGGIVQTARARTSPEFIASTVDKTTKARTLRVPTSEGLRDIEISGRLKTGSPKPTKIPTGLIKIEGRTTPKIPIKQQIKFAGTEKDIATAQRGLFIEQVKDQKITIAKEGKGLEESLFAEPTGRIRPSRLFESGRPKLPELLTGDFAVGTAPQPQIIIFPKSKIQNLPRRLERQLRKGTAPKEQLLKFQTRRTGQFKPIGALSTEVEVTLPKGEVIDFKKIGVTTIGLNRVPIFESRILKQPKLPKLPKSKPLIPRQRRTTPKKQKAPKIDSRRTRTILPISDISLALRPRLRPKITRFGSGRISGVTSAPLRPSRVPRTTILRVPIRRITPTRITQGRITGGLTKRFPRRTITPTDRIFRFKSQVPRFGGGDRKQFGFSKRLDRELRFQTDITSIFTKTKRIKGREIFTGIERRGL